MKSGATDKAWWHEYLAATIVAGAFIASLTYTGNRIDQVDQKLDRIQTDLNKKLDRNQADSNKKIDLLRSDQSHSFEAANLRFDDVNKRFDTLQQQVADLRADQATMKADLTYVKAHVDDVGKAVGARFSSVEDGEKPLDSPLSPIRELNESAVLQAEPGGILVPKILTALGNALLTQKGRKLPSHVLIYNENGKLYIVRNQKGRHGSLISGWRRTGIID